MGLAAIELSVATGASVLGATQSDRGQAAVEAAGADTLRGLTPDEYHAQRIAATPVRLAGTPQEAAQLFAFLLSTRSSYLTGQMIVLDGGGV